MSMQSVKRTRIGDSVTILVPVNSVLIVVTAVAITRSGVGENPATDDHHAVIFFTEDGRARENLALTRSREPSQPTSQPFIRLQSRERGRNISRRKLGATFFALSFIPLNRERAACALSMQNLYLPRDAIYARNDSEDPGSNRTRRYWSNATTAAKIYYNPRASAHRLSADTAWRASHARERAPRAINHRVTSLIIASELAGFERYIRQ